MTKTCPSCKNSFKTYRTAAIYCSRPCQFISQTKPIERVCTHCGLTFNKPKHKCRGKKAFCSTLCHKNFKKANARKICCIVCSKEFLNSNKKVNCCSIKCANISKQTFEIIKCAYCTSNFKCFKSSLETRKFCSTKCYRGYNKGINHPNYRPIKTTEFGKGKGWKVLAASIRARDKHICQWCNKHQTELKDTLDVHHIIARSKFSCWKDANNPTNLISLCNSCHTTIEGHITHGRLHSIPEKLRPQE